MKDLIVKVQLSIATSTSIGRMVLAYSKDRQIWYEGAASKSFIQKMGGLDRAFFKAHMEGSELVLDELVEEQNW